MDFIEHVEIVLEDLPYEIIDLGHDTPCWRWRGYPTFDGYGQIRRARKVLYAHRFYYERANGPIPAGLDIDHLCRVRPCVNPAHLEAVPRAINVRRGRKGKLTVEQLVACYEATKTERDAVVAESFGLSACYVNRIRNGHVPIAGVNT